MAIHSLGNAPVLWIIAGTPESVIEIWMSNVYSFVMVVREMVTWETTYSAYSPVQAAVRIAACGRRPKIPKDCPNILGPVMVKCWNNFPSKRPPYSKILRLLSQVEIVWCDIERCLRSR
ncbi:hypothetical protein MKX01_005824 [Papaver californicum]|nr:hypothetical protein MKX01_005824 [Papaver californicum]